MRYKYIDKILLKHDFIKCKKKIFLLYFSYILGYTFIFFINNKTLHFEHWIFLVSMVYFINLIVILPLSEFSKKIKIWGFFLLISLFFKISLEGIEIIERILKNTSNLIINSYFFIFILLSFLYYLSRVSTEIINKNESIEELYPERKEDKKSIYDFLTVEDKFNVLGIDENFGEGKTFVVNKVLEILDDSKFEVIKIKCLLLEKEEIYPYIIKQLNRVLIKNLIFTGHFEKLKNSFIKSVDGKYLGGFFNLFIRETSIDDIENFKQAIFRLNRKIILIFEDFDRNSNCEKIEKLFSFIDDFSENNIKSLVLYSSDNLKNINKKYNRNYIEKYIPLTRSLTQLSFRRILEREIKGLDKEDFYFLISIFEGDKNIFSRDFERKKKEFKFVLDFQSLTSLKMISHINWTPRNIKNFVDEVRVYFDKGLKIEKRIVIAFTFLKNLLYEEFYEKIDESFSFEKTFPINLKLLKNNTDITLEDLDILNRLIFKKYSILLNQKIEFINIGKNRIFFDDRFKNDSSHINNYLRKLNLPILKGYSIEEISECLKNIEKIILKDRKEVVYNTDSTDNIFIYALFNYFLLLRNDENKVMENNEKIVNAIKKLKSLGKTEYLSSQRRYYEKLIDCLKYEDKKEQLDSYNGLIAEYYHNDGSFENVFYLEKNFEETSISILDIFDDEENKEKFLELIYYRDDNKITDNYLTTFFKVRIQNIQIADFILNDFLKNNFELKYRDTLNLIRKNINKIIIRERCPYLLDDLTNVEFYREYIKYLEGMLKKESLHNRRISIVNKSKIIKDSIEKVIEFLNILIELENNHNIEKKEEFQLSVESYLPEEIEEIKNLTIEEEKIKKIEKIYINEGKNIEYIQRIYENVKD
jgi:archaellin